MIKKVIIAVALSVIAQMLGVYMAIAGFGILGKTDIAFAERIAGIIGQLLFFGAPIAAAVYIAKEYRANRKTIKRGDKKSLVAMFVGIAIVIGVFPAILAGEVLSEKWASWRNEVYRKHLLQEDEEWKTNQRNTVCVTKDNVSYDFEFGGIYSEYELDFQALRDKAPQDIRSQGAEIIDNQITHNYVECSEGRISPPVQRDRLKAAFESFSELAEPYRD